jgi:hypothetical protein
MDEIISQIQKVIEAILGVSFESIYGDSREQKISDARTIYIHSIYSLRDSNRKPLMDGIKLAAHLGYCSRNIYYHLSKYEALKLDRKLRPKIFMIEEKINNIAEKWHYKKHITSH